LAAIIFYISLPFICLVSILPFPVLYFLSDLLFPVSYYLVRYRKKVVMENLRNSFPEMEEQQVRAIARKFYRHFNDVLLETLKLISIRPENLRRRIRYTNPEVLTDFYKQGKSVIAILAHFNNWEWTIGLSRATPIQAVVIYKPLHNKYFDRFIKKMRERHGSELIPMREILRRMLADKRNKHLTVNAFIGDQSTIWEETQFWTDFLHQLTPVYLGAEKMALKTGHPVVFYHMKKVRRGYYEIEIITLVEDVTQVKEHEITEKHVRVLEEIIRKNPQYWLWTHRRWKLTPKKMAEMKQSS